MKHAPSIALAAAILRVGSALAQSPDGDRKILDKAQIVAKNIQTAITVHLMSDPKFRMSKQSPEDKQVEPKMLLKKNGDFEFDRTPGQEARYLMEDIRQGIHTLQAAETPKGLDAIALAGGREYWPKLRDISCRDKPGTRYYDLDGSEQYCPER